MSLTVIQPPADTEVLSQFNTIVSNAAPNDRIRQAFGAAISALAQGDAVRIEPVPQMLTTSQAAGVLGISRTTMVKLLEEGKIPFEQPNVHRLVRLRDVLDYQQSRRRSRRTFLSDLTNESMNDGTYFDEQSPMINDGSTVAGSSK